MSEEKDIVERLDSFSASWKRDRPSTASLASEAAQEIVDLRERVVALGEMVRSAVDGAQPLWSGEVAADKAEFQRLQGEVERLREGFRRINRRSSPDATRTFDGAISALEWITAEARGNLQGE